MKATFIFEGRQFTLTSDSVVSHYGQPVLEVDGWITDVAVEFDAGHPPQRSALDLLADSAGIWSGPETRRKLAELAEEMKAVTGADYDRVIEAFHARQHRLTALEAAE